MNSRAANGDPAATEAEFVSNTLRCKDLPRALWDVNAAGTVTYRATLGVNGRLSEPRYAQQRKCRAPRRDVCAGAAASALFPRSQ